MSCYPHWITTELHYIFWFKLNFNFKIKEILMLKKSNKVDGFWLIFIQINIYSLNIDPIDSVVALNSSKSCISLWFHPLPTWLIHPHLHFSLWNLRFFTLNLLTLFSQNPKLFFTFPHDRASKSTQFLI